MKHIVAALFLFLIAEASFAQAPAGAPAGSTGMCKDGTYSNAASKRGACAGHKGVKDWYAADATPATKATAPATPAPATPPSAQAGAPAPAPVPPSKAKVPSTTTAAVGGGNGQVWVNSSSKVYHCQGDRYYGKTKAGSYMTESAAVAAGNRAADGKACKAT